MGLCLPKRESLAEACRGKNNKKTINQNLPIPFLLAET